MIVRIVRTKLTASIAFNLLLRSQPFENLEILRAEFAFREHHSRQILEAKTLLLALVTTIEQMASSNYCGYCHEILIEHAQFIILEILLEMIIREPLPDFCKISEKLTEHKESPCLLMEN